LPGGGRIVCGDDDGCPPDFRCAEAVRRCVRKGDPAPLLLNPSADVTACTVPRQDSGDFLCLGVRGTRGADGLSGCLVLEVEGGREQAAVPVAAAAGEEGGLSLLPSDGPTGLEVRAGDSVGARLFLLADETDAKRECSAYRLHTECVGLVTCRASFPATMATVDATGTATFEHGVEDARCGIECNDGCGAEADCDRLCYPDRRLPDEVCDGADNDCDGVTDGTAPPADQTCDGGCRASCHGRDGWACSAIPEDGCEGGTRETDAPVALTWVPLCGGCYLMGSTQGHTDERPVHEVTVPPFEIARTEVTVATWRSCVEAGACSPPNEDPDGGCTFWTEGADDRPINCIDWHEAGELAAWVGGGARLCTEAEWEYAARSGGQQRTFPWGELPPSCERAVQAGRTEGDGCGAGAPLPACSRPAGNTDQGVCDLAGSVFEWVQDWHHWSYDGAPADGSAFLDPPMETRGCRGGSWDLGGYFLRVADRTEVPPETRGPWLGMRLCRPPPDAPPAAPGASGDD